MIEKAIFFDRDGVLNKDVNLLCRIEDVIITDATIQAFKLLNNVTCKKIVISNQTVICRGLVSEDDVNIVNEFINTKIFNETGTGIDRFYFCPHHPEATLERYREKCECRKPKPGMLLQATKDFNIDLSSSWMIGDRISDIIAGARAGCKTILIQTGMHSEKPIVSEEMDLSISPDYVCGDLLEAVEIILEVWEEH